MVDLFTNVLNFIKTDFIHLEAIGLNVSFSVWDLALFLLITELVVGFIASVVNKGGEN